MSSLEIKKYDYIDSMRGIAILAVFLTHANPHFGFYIDDIFSFGKWGVLLFFTVSAYSLLASFEQRSKTEKRFVTNYFIRRFFRIAPAYYVVLFFCYFFTDGSSHWLGSNTEVSFHNIVSHLIFVNFLYPNYANSILGVEWTINVEMIFYIFLPFIFIYLNSFKKMFLLFVFLVTVSIIYSILMKYSLDTNFEKEYTHLLFPKWFFVFAGGGACIT